MRKLAALMALIVLVSVAFSATASYAAGGQIQLTAQGGSGEDGTATFTDLGGGSLEYELVSRPHHHLICEKCHARIEVEDRFLEPLRASLLEHYGFSTNLDHFALFGICPECRT